MCGFLKIKRSNASKIVYIIYLFVCIFCAWSDLRKLGICIRSIAFIVFLLLFFLSIEFGCIICLKNYVMVFFIPCLYFRKVNYDMINECHKIAENKKQWHFDTNGDKFALCVGEVLYTFSTNNNAKLKALIKKKTGNGSKPLKKSK